MKFVGERLCAARPAGVDLTSTTPNLAMPAHAVLASKLGVRAMTVSPIVAGSSVRVHGDYSSHTIPSATSPIPRASPNSRPGP